MLILDEATALLDPVDVNFLWKIVLEEDRDDQQKPGHEGEAGEIVDVLGGLRNIRERLGPDQRQKHDFSEGDIQTGQPQNDEGYRSQPMREPFKGLKAQDLHPR